MKIILSHFQDSGINDYIIQTNRPSRIKIFWRDGYSSLENCRFQNLFSTNFASHCSKQVNGEHVAKIIMKYKCNLQNLRSFSADHSVPNIEKLSILYMSFPTYNIFHILSSKEWAVKKKRALDLMIDFRNIFCVSTISRET